MFKCVSALVCLFFISSGASATETAKLQDAVTTRSDEGFITELKFDRSVSPDQASVEFINQTVQVNVKGATFTEGKKFKKISDPRVRSVFTYQSEPDVVRTRIIHQKDVDAERFKDQVEIIGKNNSLFIHIKNSGEAMTASTSKKEFEALFADRPPIDLDRELSGPSKETEKTEDLSAEEEMLLAAAAEVSTSSKEGKSKKSENKEAASRKSKALTEEEIPLRMGDQKKSAEESSPWFRLILSMGVISVVALGLIFGVKKFSKNQSKVGGTIKVRVVSQHPLGPKKNLTVVNVAGEILLLGVTDHSINMIKSISLIDDELVDEVPSSFEDEMKSASIVTAAAAHKKITEEAEISLSSIKDRVSSRLKEMRTL